MNRKPGHARQRECTLALLLAVFLNGCDQIAGPADRSAAGEPTATATPLPARPPGDTDSIGLQLDLDKSRYLFDVTEHSLEELQKLLARVDEIAESRAAGYDQLDIVMILHGPDIRMFTYENYEKNKPLVDLAAKLDAFNIIDMKVCETSLPVIGVTRGDLPPFIESVPYAPSEKQRLTDDGYITL